MALRIERATVSTTDATETVIWNSANTNVKTVMALVELQETGLSRTHYGHWLVIGTIFSTTEGTYTVVSTEVASGGASISTETVGFAVNASDQIELNVTGIAADYDWTATIFELE